MKFGTLLASALMGFLFVQQATASSVAQPISSSAIMAQKSASILDATLAPSSEQGGGADIPSENLALLFWCMAALADGNLSGAEKACGQAIAFNPESPAPYKLRGTAYLFEGRYEQARSDFANAVQLDPTDPENHAGLAVALRDQGKYQEAIAQFSLATRLAPDDPRMWNARCWTRGLFGRDLRAGLSDCNEALRLVPGDADVLSARGLIYLRMAKLRIAIADFSAALHKKPNLALAFYGRGVARMKRGDLKGAQADILRAREVDSNVDEIFVWNPLIPQRCLKNVVRDHNWNCRPRKVPARNLPVLGKTAQSGFSIEALANNGRPTAAR